MRFSTNMSDNVLVLLVRKLSHLIIMLAPNEIGLSRNILKIKVWRDWTANSISGLNQTEHLWDCLGRQVAVSSTPLKSIKEHIRPLFQLWTFLPILVSDNIIESTENRCHK
ncbi:hypothetical protein AVEN_67053-1 [Araneus ventricosus]|uniref:Uncharacterized protein n=1 Tax=Araneus ventricosus TaxID=182803 RepID=A0A4Y2VIV4_ARAVE|nr:hypothetical protein AVEN_67053-1 [Araneus ventricosus]